MRRVLMAAAAAAVIAIATPASATVTLNTLNGNLSTKIMADEGDGDTHDVVYGTDGAAPQDVSFDGNVDIAITGGSGFAEIDPGKDVTDFYTLIIDPLYDFTEYEFAIQLLQDGNVSVYYELASGGGFQLITSGGVSDPFAKDANGNDNYLVSSTDPLTRLKIVSDVGIKMVKQNAITLAPGAVPEPATWAMMMLGFGGMGMALRRSRRRKQLMQIA